MKIDFLEDTPSSYQFWKLFETTGWNEKYQLSPDKLIQALDTSWYLCAAYDSDQLVGFGRVISDGILHAMIYELIVLPDYQGQGIGGDILHKLIDRCHESGIQDIQLFCAIGKRSFYEKRGFLARPDEAPGMQYIRGEE